MMERYINLLFFLNLHHICKFGWKTVLYKFFISLSFVVIFLQHAAPAGLFVIFHPLHVYPSIKSNPCPCGCLLTFSAVFPDDSLSLSCLWKAYTYSQSSLQLMAANNTAWKSSSLSPCLYFFLALSSPMMPVKALKCDWGNGELLMFRGDGGWRNGNGLAIMGMENGAE